jgi:hypothetical protein
LQSSNCISECFQDTTCFSASEMKHESEQQSVSH